MSQTGLLSITRRSIEGTNNDLAPIAITRIWIAGQSARAGAR
jgi:hypothetical protein